MVTIKWFCWSVLQIHFDLLLCIKKKPWSFDWSQYRDHAIKSLNEYVLCIINRNHDNKFVLLCTVVIIQKCFNLDTASARSSRSFVGYNTEAMSTTSFCPCTFYRNTDYRVVPRYLFIMIQNYFALIYLFLFCWSIHYLLLNMWVF